MQVTAIVPAAGGGTRLSAAVPKQYLMLLGIPILARTLQVLRRARVDRIILVVPADHEARCRAEILTPYGLTVDALVPGGADRQASVYAGLRKVDDTADVVLVHDGARPLVTPQIIQAVAAAAAAVGAAAVAVPVTDTIKVAGPDRLVQETPARVRLWAAQTPQAFRAALFCEAHERALRDGYRGTDDSVLVERLGHPVQLVLGAPENLKITTPADLALAEQILRDRGRGEA